MRKSAAARATQGKWWIIPKPLIDPATQKLAEHFARIKSFGSPHVGWIRVSGDPADPKLFAIKTGKEINRAR